MTSYSTSFHKFRFGHQISSTVAHSVFVSRKIESIVIANIKFFLYITKIFC